MKHTATEQFAETATQVREDIRALGTAARNVATDQVDHWYKEGREKVIKFEQGFENRIRNHPLQSLMIASGVGLLAGYWLTHRSGSKK